MQGSSVWRVVGVALLAIVAVRLTGRLHDVVGLVLVAAALAVITEPVRRRLAVRLPDGVAVALTALLSVVVAVVLAVVLLRSLGSEVGRVAEIVRRHVAAWTPGSLPARTAASLDLERSLDRITASVPTAVIAGEGSMTGAARRLVDLLLLVILAAFFQSAAGPAVDRLTAQWDRDERADARQWLRDLVQRGGGYVRRSFLLGAGLWLAVSLFAWALGLDGALVLGAWAAWWSLVPWVGAWVGPAPLVAVAAGGGTPRAVVAAMFALAAWWLVGEARRRWVEAHTVQLGAAVSAVAVAAGVSAAGLPGAAVALVASCTVAAALTSTFERPRWPWPRSEGLDAVAPVVDGSVRAVPTLRSVGIAIAACVAAALVWMLIGSLGGLGVWLAVAGLVAVALHRLVAMIERRARAPRSVAVGIVCCVSITVVAGALALGIGGGVSSSQRLSEGLPAAVTDMEDLPVVGGFLREREAGVWLSAQMEDLPQRLQDSGSADEWLPAVGARLLDLWWVVVLAAALLVDGGSVVAGALRRVPVRWRRQAIRLTDASHAAVAGYLAGAVLVAGINATVVLTLALLTGIALAPVLAVWAFMWNFVPQIGGFMGGFPLVLLALAEGPMAALLAGTAFVAYQFLENHLIQPTVISEAIDIPAWMALLAALAGGAAAGVVGAVVLTPLVGVIRVIITQLRRDDFPGATANADRPPLAVLP